MTSNISDFYQKDVYSLHISLCLLILLKRDLRTFNCKTFVFKVYQLDLLLWFVNLLIERRNEPIR